MNDLRRRLAGNMTRMRDAYLEPLNPDHAALEVAREMHSDGELGSHAEDSSNDEVDEILGGAACVRPPREPEAEVSYLLDSSSEDESSQATTEDDTEAPEDPVSENPYLTHCVIFTNFLLQGPAYRTSHPVDSSTPRKRNVPPRPTAEVAKQRIHDLTHEEDLNTTIVMEVEPDSFGVLQSSELPQIPSSSSKSSKKKRKHGSFLPPSKRAAPGDADDAPIGFLPKSRDGGTTKVQGSKGSSVRVPPIPIALSAARKRQAPPDEPPPLVTSESQVNQFPPPPIRRIASFQPSSLG